MTEIKAQKNIVVCGYPKSGTHWLTMLVADLCNGLYAENWGFKPKQNIDAQLNTSEFVCYKSHHLFDDLSKAEDKEIYKIIYIVRDPRDIAISGSYFFRFTFPRLKNTLKFFPFSAFVYRKAEGLLNRLMTLKQKRNEMFKALAFGNIKVSAWCKPSWPLHYTSFNNKAVLFVKYEDLQTNLKLELAKMADFLTFRLPNKSFKKLLPITILTRRNQPLRAFIHFTEKAHLTTGKRN